MEGKPLNIEFIPGAKPTAVHTPILVPNHWKKREKEELDRDVALGILEPVPEAPQLPGVQGLLSHRKWTDLQ